MRAGTRTLRRGFLWLGSATLFARLVDLGAIVLVLGNISAAQLGLASLAWTAVSLAEPLASAGAQWSLLTIKRLGRATADAALALSLLGAALTTALVVLLAPLVSRWFDAPELHALLAVGALKLLAAGPAAVLQQRLARALRHRELAAAGAFATLLSALLRVGLALAGQGAWALVLAHASYSWLLLLAVGLMARPHWPRRFDLQHTRALLPAGLSVMLGQALSHWAKNLDYLFVGALLGVAPLGLYRVAFDLAMEPAMAAGDVVARSAAATLHRLRDAPDKLVRTFRYAVRFTLQLSLPLCLLTFWFAEDLLELAQDQSFVAAAPAVRWLSVAAILRVLLGLYTPLALALDKPRLSLRANAELCLLLLVSLAACLALLGDLLSGAAAGVAWCISLALALASTQRRTSLALASVRSLTAGQRTSNLPPVSRPLPAPARTAAEPTSQHPPAP